MTKQEFIEQYCENFKKSVSESKDVTSWYTYIGCDICPFKDENCSNGCEKILERNLCSISISPQEKETIKKGMDILSEKICSKYERCTGCPLESLCRYADISIEELAKELKIKLEEV